ncbi:MAG TPA: hypothetical protein VLN73_04415 [Alphaproteobacteria bacterium]|nr:hypothetical protein [Alphaproteobacteria bacterium]
MTYRFAAGLDKNSVPAQLARDSNLSAECLRVALALFRHVTQSSRVSATLRDIEEGTGMSQDQARAALLVLRQAGYVEGDATGAPPPSPSFRPPGRERSGRLDPGIMDYEMDIEGLIRAGDANVRGTRPQGSAETGKLRAGQGPVVRRDSGETTLDPLMRDDSQPPAMRFMTWLRFVLGTEELEACDRFALDHQDEWNLWVECFPTARAVGKEDELLEDIRRRLSEVSPGITLAPPKPGVAGRRPRPH